MAHYLETNLNTPKQHFINKNNKNIYRFRTNTQDLKGARQTATKYKISLSKAIGIGLNYLRKNPPSENITIEKIIEKEQIKKENKNIATTIALTEENYKYLMDKPSKEKYKTLMKASYYSKIIYNNKKDTCKNWDNKNLIWRKD